MQRREFLKGSLASATALGAAEAGQLAAVQAAKPGKKALRPDLARSGAPDRCQGFPCVHVFR
jgi:hypothetical protein